MSDGHISPQSADERLQRIYEENLGAIFRFIFSKVGKREEAEDLTSQVFLKAVHHIDLTLPEGMQRRWLYQVARTTIADHWRAVHPGMNLSLDALMEDGWEGPMLTTIANSDDENQSVNALLAQLPEMYRHVLSCRFLLGYSVRETAEHLHLTEANVKVIQLRALKKAATLQHTPTGGTA